mmetsp:Transcript_64315/g.73834  ORF Transcript_64315/g.73834 Transcript_64315/m.73834 type:complete len:462 (+) Transcript_64315:603-1988(+)|eukprot:CAMPEP_0115018598 /NCGR_PEP_ID=MMETSP0216-20121206/28921_1 /TAXON_ID=223996 /ORGANISM="Protocruzia adherens, Strain Boccale" /LENGTH=461 /DNA_ID=CAMNT_0002389863 /DNA_START=575 /DNA_END=1960 /DNA_ORIENTATION=-
MLVKNTELENTPISMRRTKTIRGSKTGPRSRLLEKTLSKATKLKKSLSSMSHSANSHKETPFRSIENLLPENDLLLTPQNFKKEKGEQDCEETPRSTEYSSSIKQRPPSSRLLQTASPNNYTSDDEDEEDNTVKDNERTSYEHHSSLKKLLSYDQGSDKTSQDNNSLRKRKRKSPEQLNFLAVEFEKNPYWSKEKTMMLADKTGLSEAQVYKWSWDQRRKRFGPEAAMKKYEDFTGLCSQNSCNSTAASAAVGTSSGVKKYKEDGLGGFIVIDCTLSEETSTFKKTSSGNQGPYCEDVSILDTAASFVERLSGGRGLGREPTRKIPDFRYDDDDELMQEDHYMGVDEFRVGRNGVEGILFCEEQYKPSQLDLKLGEDSQEYRKTVNETLYGSTIKTFDVESNIEESNNFLDDLEACLPQICDDHIQGKIQTPVKGSLEREISCHLPDNEAFKLSIGDILRA